MSSERITRHQLLRHGAREVGLQAAPDVDPGELVLLRLRLRAQFASLEGEIRALGVSL